MPKSQIFISYAHLDNREGWINRFHTSLKSFLSTRLGKEAEVWRDEKLKGNDIFSNEILDQIDHAAVLVSVLTPRYIKSEWCTREIRTFCEHAEKAGGMLIENKIPVFKVLKLPVDAQDTLPQYVRDVLGYEFFTFDEGVPLELDPAFGESFAQEYNRKVAKLAWHIKEIVEKLESAGVVSSEDGGKKPTIYLAECGSDQKGAREVLEGELRMHGYSVLPDAELPREEEPYRLKVARLLESCSLSVHLVGESPGWTPDGPGQKSITVLQNEMAVARSKSDGLRRIVWLPEGTHSEQAPQQTFIELLHHDADTQFGADLLTGNMEGLRVAIHATLEQLQKPRKAAAEAVDASSVDSRLIYLVCDEKDRKATVPLRKFLRAQGFEVRIPAFDGDAGTLREERRQSLTDCDAVLVFYGLGDEGWRRAINTELKRLPGYRAGKPLLAHATYLAEPRTVDKDDLIDMEEPDLIDGRDGFAESAVAAFVDTLKAGGNSGP